MPGGVLVGNAVTPQIGVPAEPVNRLATDAAMARAKSVFALTIGRRRRTERGCEVGLYSAEPPHPARRRTAFGGERPAQAIGEERVVAPIRFDGEPLRRRREGLAQGM